MTRLEELLLLILHRAKDRGIKNLSEFQLFKIPYLLQVLAMKYVGTALIPETTFVRDKNGPISIDIYSALEKLIEEGRVKKEVLENKDYGFPRYAHSLAGDLPQLNFSEGELIFLDNFLSKLLPLSQSKLKKIVYSTEPMEEIMRKEKGERIMKGIVMNFNSVVVDPDIVDTYSDAK